MNITVLGARSIGATLGKSWVRAGHRVVFGVRNVDNPELQALVKSLGDRASVKTVSDLLAKGLGLDLEPEIVSKYREGDIRHCVADISKAKSLLGYEPGVSLEQGIPELLSWVRAQAAQDQVLSATAELESRQLVR